MAKVIAVANQKGGCGKTSVTANLGIGLAMAGEKVLLIDADPQGSLTVSLGYPDPDNIPQTLATIMMGIINEDEFPKEFAMLHHEEDVDIVPANMELSGLEVSLSNAMSREMILKEYIDSVRDEYSYILIWKRPERLTWKQMWSGKDLVHLRQEQGSSINWSLQNMYPGINAS